MRILVTGATGFIGRALVPVLLAEGHEVLAGTRHPGRYRGAGTPVALDIEDPNAVEAALSGCEAAYFLVHGMSDHGDFQKREQQAADVFGAAAGRHGARVVYLGGLGEGQRSVEHSEHLRSRHRVGETLQGLADTVELQAAIVIGAGSAAFEMLRTMVDWIPLMVLPDWVRTRSQPIALDDVIRYLVAALRLDAGEYEVGGPEVLTYEEMILRYAQLTGRRRAVVKVPVPLPDLAARAATTATEMLLRIPQPSSIVPLALRLAESLTVEVVVTDDRIRQLVPGPLIPFEDAVRRAGLGRPA